MARADPPQSARGARRPCTRSTGPGSTGSRTSSARPDRHHVDEVPGDPLDLLSLGLEPNRDRDRDRAVEVPRCRADLGRLDVLGVDPCCSQVRGEAVRCGGHAPDRTRCDAADVRTLLLVSARSARLDLRITPELRDRIDAARGSTPRTAWIEQAVETALQPDRRPRRRSSTSSSSPSTGPPPPPKIARRHWAP